MTEWAIKYWVEAIFAGIICLLALGYRKLKKRLDCQDSDHLAIVALDTKVAGHQVSLGGQELIKEGVQALLWNALYQIYNDAERVGCLSIDALKNAENIYAQYHALGGNGTGTELYQRLCDLPTKRTRQGQLDNS